MLGTEVRFHSVGKSDTYSSFLPGPGDHVISSSFDTRSKSESRKTSFGASFRNVFKDKEKELSPSPAQYSPHKYNNFGEKRSRKALKQPENAKGGEILQDGKHYLDSGPGYYIKQKKWNKNGFSDKDSFGTSLRPSISKPHIFTGPSDYRPTNNRFGSPDIGSESEANSANLTGFSRGNRFLPSRGEFLPGPGSHNLAPPLPTKAKRNKKQKPTASFSTLERPTLVKSLRQAGQWSMEDIPGPGKYLSQNSKPDESYNIRCRQVNSQEVNRDLQSRIKEVIYDKPKTEDSVATDIFKVRPKDVLPLHKLRRYKDVKVGTTNRKLTR